MADVARVLPRHWDGQRLLRFLAGLALLALAFAAHAGLIAPAVTPLSPATTTAVTVDVPAATTVDVPAPPATRPQPVTVGGVPAPAGEAPVLPASVVPAGTHPGAHGSRGPPLA